MSTSPLESPTFARLLARQVAAKPDETALVADGETFTWSALEQRVASAAAQLAEHGVARGGRVACWMPNGADYVITVFAVARLGAMAVHVNTRFGAHEVGNLVQRTRPTVLVTRAGLAGVDLEGIRASIPAEMLTSVRTVLHGYAGARGGVAPSPARELTEAVGTADDPALVFTTGGTTAQPKLVLHPQRSIVHHAEAVATRIGLDQRGAVLLGVVPFCGTFGNVALMAAVAGGARIVTLESFDERRADAALREHRVTHLVGDDRMMARLAAVAEERGPHTTMRVAAVAGFHPGSAEAFARGAAVGLRPHAVYGSSEVQALFAVGDPAALGMGAVTPVDPEASYRVTDDDDGQLLLAGPSLFAGYLDDPEATRKVVRDGFFSTGDRARSEGPAFHFDGRLGDTLRLGGFLVSPLEIETFLQSLPAVDSAQVVAAEEGGRRVAFAFVREKPGEQVDEAALIATCQAKLAKYKVPARIVSVEAYPTSNGPNGPKISKAELRTQAEALLRAAPRPTHHRS